MEFKWLLILFTLILVFSVATSCTTVGGKKDTEAVTTEPARTVPDEKADKKEAQHHFLLARQHLKAGELEQAEAEIGNVLVLDPAQPIPHLLAGDVYFAQADYEKALEQYQRAASLDRAKGLPHVKIGRIYGKLDRLDKALVSYQTAIRLEPEVPGFYREFAHLCRRMGLDAEAGQADEKAERLLKARKGRYSRENQIKIHKERGAGVDDPDSATIKIMRLADELFKENLLSLAIEEYRIAAARAPNNAVVQQKLGDAYARKGMLSEAIEQYQRVVELQPQAPWGYLGLGVVYSKMFDIDTSLDYFGKGLSLAPDSVPLRFEKALAYYKIDRLDKAMAELEKIVAPDDANPHPEKLLQKIKAEKEAQAGFVGIQNGQFVLKHDPRQDEAFINYTLRSLQEAYQKLSTDMTYQPEHKIVVKLYPGLKAFHRAASTPEWFRGGVASAKDYKVLLATPRKQVNIDKFPQVIIHELTHVFTNLTTYGKHPAWIHEGLALYEAGQWDEKKEMALRQAVSEDKLFELYELDKPFTRLKQPGQIRLAYAQSYAVVEYIMDNYGKDKLLDVLKAFSRGRDFDEAAPEVFGLDSKTFEENWREDLKRKYAG